MTRVALYARYSTDNQREASIEDRFRIFREEVKREKWKIVGAYRNAGISGRVHYGVPGPGSAQLHRCSCRQSGVVTRTEFGPREDWKSQLRFRLRSQLATSGKLLLGRRGACGGM
jgi:hypothetical protein